MFYKAHTGVKSIGYEDTVREALCFGWIDSLVKRLDDDRYAFKVTPRQPTSKWSDLNRKRWLELKAAGLRLVAADQEAPASAWDSDLSGPLAIVVGSEGSGLSGQTKRRCDLLVSFPMAGRVASLNAATAGALLLFEVVRQRR